MSIADRFPPQTDLVPVDVVKPIQQHLHDLFDLGQGELHVGVAEQPRQVMLAEIEHQVNAALVAVKLGG